MKKIVTWILALCMAAVLPLQAAAAVETEVHASAGAVKPGEEVVCTVTVSGAGDIRSMAVLPLYDANSFTLLEGEWLLSGMLSDFDMEKGLGVIALAKDTQVNTEVFQFKLQAKEDAAPAAQQVGSTVVLMDAQSQRSELTATQAEIRISHDVESDVQVPAGEGGTIRWLWFGIAAVAVVCLAVGAVVILRKKKNP